MAKEKYDTTLARIAGNVASTLVDDQMYISAKPKVVAGCAVEIARAIVDETKRVTAPREVLAPFEVAHRFGLSADLRQLPLNVQGLLAWCRDNNSALLPMVELLVKADTAGTVTGSTVRGTVDLMLVGFEAGRQFERDYPHIEPGAGYLP